MEALRKKISQAEPCRTFMENAANIFEAAEAVSRAGGELSEWSILIGEDGGIHMLAASSWSLDSLQAHHGARMAYRVRQLDQTVRLEGRAGSRTCLFETAKPDGAARLLLAQLRPAQLTLTHLAIAAVKEQ